VAEEFLEFLAAAGGEEFAEVLAHSRGAEAVAVEGWRKRRS
jgi:hypothetical protein